MKKERIIRTAELTKYFLITVLTVGCICLGTLPIFAQNAQSTSNTVDKNLKSSARVNPSTRAMELSIPLGSYPGRGGNSMPVLLNYSSKVWDMKMTNFRQAFEQVPTTQNYDYIEYESADISPIFSDKTLGGWTSSLQPVVLDTQEEIYNESGESYHLDNSSAINGICNSLSTPGWHCWIDSTSYFLTSLCGSGYALGFTVACGNDGEEPEIITPYYICMDSPGGGGPVFNPTPIPAGSPTPVPASTPLPQIPNQVHRLRIETSDGVSHEFRKDDEVHNCNNHPQDCSPNYDVNGTYLSVDGTGMRLEKGQVFEREVRDILYLPDGSKYIFPDQTPGSHYDIAEKFVDKNGNVSTYNIQKTEWTDTLGRKINDPMVNPWFTGQHPQPGTQSYDLKGINEETRTYEMNWSKLENVLESQSTTLKYMGDDTCQSVQHGPITGDSLFQSQDVLITPDPDPIVNRVLYIRRHRACASLGANAPTFNPVVLDYIKLPDNRKYQFKYNEYGEITKIIYPTGSYERFEYGKVSPLGLTALEVYDQANRGVTKRYISFDGNPAHEQLWQFTNTTTTAPDGTSTETAFYTNADAPSGTGFGFNDPRSGMVKEEKMKDANGVLRSRTINDWVNTDPRDNGQGTRDPRLKRSVTIIFDPGSNAALATLNETDYDENAGVDSTYFSHLNVTRKKSYHYAVISDKTTVDNEVLNWTTITGWFTGKLAAVSETDYSYGSEYRDRGIIGLPVETRVLDPANNAVLSKTQFYYDDPVLENDPPAAGWEDPGSSLRGNVTYSRTLLKDPTVSSSTEDWIETRAQYDNFGNLRTAQDAAGNVTEMEYNAEYDYAYQTKVITPAPESSSSGAHGTTETSEVIMTYDMTTGLPLSVTDLGGLSSTEDDRTTTTEYSNPLLRPTNVTAPNGQQTITEYNDTPDGTTGFVSVKVKKQLDESNWGEATTFMDKGGRVRQTKNKDSQGDVYVDTLYDSVGRANCVTSPYRANDTVYWNKTRFDEMSRAVESYAPATMQNNDCQAASYSSLQSLGTTSFNFSTSVDIGTVVISNDASLRKGRSITNALGQLIRVDEPTAFGGTADQDLGAIGTPIQPTYYTYSKLGKMVKVQQGKPGETIQYRYFLYDNIGRLLRVKQPEQEANSSLATTLSSGNNDWSAGFTYDVMGNMLTATDAKGTVIHNSYDNAGRVKTRSYTNEPTGITTPQVDYYYDGLGVSGADFAKGELTKVSSSVSETRNTNFDDMGRVLSSEQVTDGQTYPMSYKYNLSGALTEETYPSGEVVRNFLETDGDLSRIAVSGLTYASDFSYTAKGKLASVRLGNGRWETGKLNEREQVTEIMLGTAINDGSLWKVKYEYGALNADGSIDTAKNSGTIAKQTTSFSGLSSNLVQTYKYDALNRLTEAKEPTGEFTNNWVQTLGYDRFGNRTSINQTGFASITQTPAIDANTNRFAASQGYTYDKNGNIIGDPADGGRSFVFNGDNKQIQVYKNGVTPPVGTYSYDGNGKRVKKVSDLETTVFVYDANGLVIAEYSNQVSSNPTISYTATDRIGSPRAITDKQGNIISRRDFMPFGEELNAGVGNRSSNLKYALAGQDNLRKRFTGYEKDAETGLDFAEARYYNNPHGRFTAVDPLLASGKSANPQTFNRYAYVLNNPLVFTDPTGMQTTTYVGPVYINTTKPGFWKEKSIPPAGNPNRKNYQLFTGDIRNYDAENGSRYNLHKGGWEVLGKTADFLKGANLAGEFPELEYRASMELAEAGRQASEIGWKLIPDYCRAQASIPILAGGLTLSKNGNLFAGASRNPFSKDLTDWLKDIRATNTARLPKLGLNIFGGSCGYYFDRDLREDQRDDQIAGPDFEVQVPIPTEPPFSVTYAQSLDGGMSAAEVGTPGFGVGISYTSEKIWDWNEGCTLFRRPKN